MKLNEYIKKIKEKYPQVALKKVAYRKPNELYHFYYKNKRAVNELIIVDKKRNIVFQQKTKKADIKIFIAQFKKNINEVLENGFQIPKDEAKKENIKELIKSKTNFLNNIQNKSLPFKNNKELQDYSFLLIVQSFLIDYLISHKIVKENDGDFKALRKLDKDEAFVYEIQQHMLRLLRNCENNLSQLKAYSDDILDKVFNKKENKDKQHYPIMFALYLLETWRYDVADKTIQIHYNYRKLDDLIKRLEEDLCASDFDIWRDNSQRLAYETFAEIYKTDRRMTKNERIKFFNKLKGNKDA